MFTNIQYIVDDTGNKVSVILPFSDWEKLTNDYQQLQNKLEVIKGIQNSMNEIQEAKKAGKKLQSLSDFLHQSTS